MRLAEMPKLKVAVPLLVICLAASLFFSIYPLLNKDCEISENENSKSKTFVFFEMNQYPFAIGENYRKLILNSTEFVRVEVTFNWETDDLIVSAKVSDDDFHGFDYLGLLFDTNEDGIFEGIFRLNANNYTLTAAHCPMLTDFGGITKLTQLVDLPSTWHYCTFNNSSGYSFYFWIPKEGINFQQPMYVHLCFGDMDASLVIPDWEPATAYWEFEV